MKEKFVMTSLVAGTFVDVGTTMVALDNNFREGGIFGSVMFEQENIAAAYLTRVAVTAVMIGLYALSKENEQSNNKSYRFVIDGWARAANIINWGVAALNAVRLAGLS